LVGFISVLISLAHPD